jgi:Clp amino terminal domain, pathogenicity island component
MNMSETPDKHNSRRTFLKGAGIAAAGIFAVTRLFRPAWARKQPRATPVPTPSDERMEAADASSETTSPGHWPRFTERVRRIVFHAQEEAARMDSNFVGPEHLCVAFLSQYDCAGFEVLRRLREEQEPLGIPIGRVVPDLKRLSVRGPGFQGQDMQLTPAAKRVIDYAYEEARSLRNNYVGTEHLFLGLLQERDALPSQVLIGKGCIGADLDHARQVALQVQTERGNRA